MGEDWWDADVPCRDQSIYFDSGDEDNYAYVMRRLWPIGRELCAECPVRQACLDAALWEEATTTGRQNHRFHLRGGMGPDQREAEHQRRGMKWLCTQCHGAERLTHGDLCRPCADTAIAIAQREKRMAEAIDVWNVA